MPRIRTNRIDLIDFPSPRAGRPDAGRAAALWTRWDAPYFGGPYDRVADLRLWLVRECRGRPTLSCLRPRVDPAAGVAAIEDDGLLGSWDLDPRGGPPTSLLAVEPPLADLARSVARMVARQWASAPAEGLPLPATFAGFSRRIPARRTAEFDAALARGYGDAPSSDHVRLAWERIPARFRSPDGSTRLLYPAAFVASDSPHGYASHPETLDPAPDPAAESAAGWMRSGSGWLPRVPAGSIVYAATARLGGLEAANPAFHVYKELGLLRRGARAEDRAEVDAASARLADSREFAPRDRLELCEAMRRRLSPRVKFTPDDLTTALLHPRRPVVASTHPRLVAFKESELAAPARRGWDLRGFRLPAAARPVAAGLDGLAA